MIPIELTQLTKLNNCAAFYPLAAHPLKSVGTYREKLQPWCIIRLLPNLQRVTVARFTRRNDAEAHLLALRRLMPDTNHCLVFATQEVRGQVKH
ncbi:MAG: hypothetical protein SW833_24125 [Cyanobacteriota bacterium]|nr:hypothetical protein [Cyanobacteriota bacterium]